MTTIFVEPLVINEDWLHKNANTFTFATLCSLVGLNPKNKQLNKDHVKTVRRKLLLRYHPDKCSIENAASYFRFYKDCLDQLDVKFESFSFMQEYTNTRTANTPTFMPSTQPTQQQHPPPPQRPKQTPKEGYSTSAGDNNAFYARYQEAKPTTPSNSNTFSSSAFPTQEAFKAFLERARQEELRKNASAYNYESQEQTGNRFASSSDSQQQRSGPRNVEEINQFFTARQEEKFRNYEKPTAKMAEEYEKMFSAYQRSQSGGGGNSGGNAPKFSNEMFEDMLRNTMGRTTSGVESDGGGGGGGGSGGFAKKIKPVSLLSNSSSSRLDYAQSLFDGNQINQDDDSSIFLSGGSKNTYGLNVRDAHDPRKHLMSQGLHGAHPGQHRTAQQFENMRNEDIFQHATSKEQQQAFLDEQERRRQLRNQERLYRMYAGSV